MSFLYGNTVDVISNRRQFLAHYDLKLEDCVAASTEHQTNIVLVGKNDRGCGMFELSSAIKADALITQQTGLVLFLLTADCLPVTFYDSKNGVVALAHLSRANTELNFMEKIALRLIDQFGSKPDQLLVSIGPAIHAESYAIDLVKTNIEQLLNKNILEQNVTTSPVNTFNSRDYFSHRRSMVTGEPEGRFATIAFLKK